ncbi:TatD family hydrolase [candidate division KSB1 bacterium]|nr:TatD family hydrolase [candidate division KSB1 bacterium]
MEKSENIFFVDTHFHLDLAKNPEKLIHEIEKNQIYTIAVTNAPAAFPFTFSFCTNMKYIQPSIGLHPQLARERQQELSQFDEALKKTKYVGEIGLDYSGNDKLSEEIQRNVFKKILEKCAYHKDKILSIHSRRSAEDIISFIGNNYPGKIILHWYSGNLKLLEKAIKYGFYFSVNYAMSISKNGKSIIQAIPLDRLLTESDGPFIKIKGKPCEPMNISYLIVKIAKILNKNPLEFKNTVFSNFKKVIT